MKNNTTIDVIQLTEENFEGPRVHKHCWILRKIKIHHLWKSIRSITYKTYPGSLLVSSASSTETGLHFPFSSVSKVPWLQQWQVQCTPGYSCNIHLVESTWNPMLRKDFEILHQWVFHEWVFQRSKLGPAIESEKNFSDISTECSSHHQGEGEEVCTNTTTIHCWGYMWLEINSQ